MATGKKRIHAYVSLSTYEALKSQAESRDISLSELAGEILQTQSVFTSSSEITSENSVYVTKEQLYKVLGELRREIEREIVREVNKAELQWEANANSLVAMTGAIAKSISSPEFRKETGIEKIKKKHGLK